MLQEQLTEMHEVPNTVDPESRPHRKLGIQLHRFPGMGGFHEGLDDDPDFCVTVFVVIGEITKSNFHLPYGDDWLEMEINGVPVRVVR